MMALQQQGKLNKPVLHPTTVMMMIMMGRTIARQKFLILFVHLKSRKQGRLKKEVHCVSHICAERCSMVSTMPLTSLLTLSMAVFTVETVFSCSQLALVYIWSTALAIVDCVTLMAVADVDLTVSTAEFMREVACVCIRFRLLCVVETMELAVLLRVDSAEEMREVVVLDRAVAVPLMVFVVVVTADESEEVTEEVTEEAASVRSPSPKVAAGQRRSQRPSRLITMVFIPNQLVYSDQHRPIIYSPRTHHYPTTHLILPDIIMAKPLRSASLSSEIEGIQKIIRQVCVDDWRRWQVQYDRAAHAHVLHEEGELVVVGDCQWVQDCLGDLVLRVCLGADGQVVEDQLQVLIGCGGRRSEVYIDIVIQGGSSTPDRSYHIKCLLEVIQDQGGATLTGIDGVDSELESNQVGGACICVGVGPAGTVHIHEGQVDWIEDFVVSCRGA